MNGEALFSSDSQHWRTPPELLTRVRVLRGDGVIGLDPCAAQMSEHWFAHTNYNGRFGADGLTAFWHGRGLVYVNPPYGRAIGAWTRKAAGERLCLSCEDEVVMLLPARTDTRWFQEDVARTAQAVCFLRGRVKFVDAEHGAPFPSALAYWGDNKEAFALVFGERGVVWVR